MPNEPESHQHRDLAEIESASDQQRLSMLGLAADLRLPRDTGPQLTDDQIDAYVDGTANEIDLEVIESEMDFNPQLRSLIEAARAAKLEAEMTAVPEPVAKRSWLSSIFAKPASRFAFEAVGALGLAAVFAVVFISGQSGASGQQGPVAILFPPDDVRLKELQARTESDARQIERLQNDNRDLQVRVGNLTQLGPVARRDDLIQDGTDAYRIPSQGALTLVNGKLPNGGGGGDLVKTDIRRGMKTEQHLIGPIQTTVRTVQPILRWQLVPGVQGYLVTISEGGQFIVERAPVTDIRFPVPEGKLKAGHTYEWRIETIEPGGAPSRDVRPDGPVAATFRVADEATGKNITRDLQKAGNSHLEKAAVFIRYGLLDEAIDELNSLRKQNKKSKAVQDMITLLQSHRRELLAGHRP